MSSVSTPSHAVRTDGLVRFLYIRAECERNTIEEIEFELYEKWAGTKAITVTLNYSEWAVFSVVREFTLLIYTFQSNFFSLYTPSSSNDTLSHYSPHSTRYKYRIFERLSGFFISKVFSEQKSTLKNKCEKGEMGNEYNFPAEILCSEYFQITFKISFGNIINSTCLQKKSFGFFFSAAAV